MRHTTILIISSCLALAACSSAEKTEAPKPSLLESIPFIYKPDIQQGNILSQEQINQLQPGMSKRQVRFLMGTPLLIDVFHQDRWDYLYTMKKRFGPPTRHGVSLFFDGDSLVRVEGDFKPEPFDPALVEPKESVVDVPDYEPQKKGIFKRTLETIGLSEEE